MNNQEYIEFVDKMFGLYPIKNEDISAFKKRVDMMMISIPIVPISKGVVKVDTAETVKGDCRKCGKDSAHARTDISGLCMTCWDNR